MRKLSNILAISILLLGMFSIPSSAQEDQAEGYEFTDQVRLETSSVKDQHRSGTCWCYATVSFLETELLRMGQPEYDLSEIYLVRHTYLQKARDYIRFHGHNNFNQGGQAHDAMTELTQHGIVPEEAYPGLEYGTEKHVHGEVVSAMTGYVKGVEDNGRRAITPAWDEGFNGILDAYFGEVPETFEYEGKSYTPKSFAQSLNINPDDYVELTSFTHHPWYKAFDLEVPDNWAHEDYYNLPLDELVEVMNYSLQEGYSVVWDGDVSSRGFSHGNGIAVVPEDEDAKFKEQPVAEKHITEQYRQEQFNNQTMTDDHLMHLTGIGEDQKGTRYYLTKNSWDSTGNNYGGFLYMSEPYIRLNTVAIMVHKDAIPDGIREKLDL
jgi:bleomycin hydrolase